MQLLRVTMGVCSALRSATNAPSSRSTVAVAKRAPILRSKAAVAAKPVTRPQAKWIEKELQQLWELSKISTEDLYMKHVKQKIEDGKFITNSSRTVKELSDNYDFASIEKLLGSLPDNDKAPNGIFLSEVLWAAVLAKSIGCLSPSILDWIENAVNLLSVPIETKKESMIWLLSILRGDLPMLQQLQQESINKNGVVGPEIEREKTVMHAALAYLEVGKKKEFRSLWTSLGASVLAEEEQQVHQHQSAILHRALLRSAGRTRHDSSMLRWYAESLVANQRTPIPEDPQFNAMMIPAMRAFGGKIEKWENDDERLKKLRKWRDYYDDAKLDTLVNSMLDFFGRQAAIHEYVSREDLKEMGRMFNRVRGENGGRETVVVDWLSLAMHWYKVDVNRLLPKNSLLVVGRKKGSSVDRTPSSPKENDRVKVFEVASRREINQDVHDICSMILAVATRGHLLTNDKARGHIVRFFEHLKEKSRDVTQSTLLKNYLNDAVVRYGFTLTCSLWLIIRRQLNGLIRIRRNWHLLWLANRQLTTLILRSDLLTTTVCI